MDKKDLRKCFRNSVFLRDNYTCQICGISKHENELDAHHITDRHEMPNGGYVLENGITVCKESCHLLVEKFHISDNKEWNIGLHPDDLYNKINSSYELAFKISEDAICNDD